MIDFVASCPICQKKVKERASNPAFPFCNTQCQMIDLGQWFDEKYRIAGPAAGSAEDEDGDSAEQSEHSEHNEEPS